MPFDELKDQYNRILADVQMNRVFPDGKTFVDCIPRFPVEEIYSKYNEAKNKQDFDLKKFVLDNYQLPVPSSNSYKSDLAKSVSENIEVLWGVLTHQPSATLGSLIPLTHPYIVPGGRFGEIYYWDSYFTMLGLSVSGKTDMIEHMVNNFAHLINRFGFIPNGNRTYYLGRSQPPFFSLMVKLLKENGRKTVLVDYLPQLEREYNFWIKGAGLLNKNNIAADHVVQMPGAEIMNRYWDEYDSPRPESYREDVELIQQAGQDSRTLCRHLRAGAESGWDFSSRWFKNKNSFNSIHTTDIIPVDLNCLLVHLEETLAGACSDANDETGALKYRSAAQNRKSALQKYCWNEAAGFYFDYDFISKTQKDIYSLAAVFPLFFKISSTYQAAKVAAVIEQQFLCAGGLITTLENTGQQWDAPNGWAPLHWITIAGLENYGYSRLAQTIATRWINLCMDIFGRTGKLMEKYNVIDTSLEAGGGEYPGQDGFGWTNGVLLALIAKYGKE